MTNTELLKARIALSGYRHGHIARQLGVGTATLSKKIANQSDFKGEEIRKLCELLEINLTDMNVIFFDSKVAK